MSNEVNESDPTRQNELAVGSGVIFTQVKLMDVYALRDKGLDLGNLAEDHIHKISSNDAAAYEVAWLLWQERLKVVGVETFSAWCELADESPDFFRVAADAIRGWLSVFFPVIAVIQAEYREAMAEGNPGTK